MRCRWFLVLCPLMVALTAPGGAHAQEALAGRFEGVMHDNHPDLGTGVPFSVTFDATKGPCEESANTLSCGPFPFELLLGGERYRAMGGLWIADDLVLSNEGDVGDYALFWSLELVSDWGEDSAYPVVAYLDLTFAGGEWAEPPDQESAFYMGAASNLLYVDPYYNGGFWGGTVLTYTPGHFLDDADGDGVSDAEDNCPLVPNADQADSDPADEGGDACDGDSDDDGIDDVVDTCPAAYNPDQADSDADGAGDVCDPDDDGDGWDDAVDTCPLVADPGQVDSDHDGLGDACDGDDDADGVDDTTDACPGTPMDVAVGEDGCSGTQYVARVVGPCAGYRNHGQYVSAVTQASTEALSAGLLSHEEKAVLTRTAARNSCP